MKNKVVVYQTWRQGDSYTERGICYGLDKEGQHVIRIDWPAGEDSMPSFNRFDQIGMARECWRRTTAQWAAAGWKPQPVERLIKAVAA